MSSNYYCFYHNNNQWLGVRRVCFSNWKHYFEFITSRFEFNSSILLILHYISNIISYVQMKSTSQTHGAVLHLATWPCKTIYSYNLWSGLFSLQQSGVCLLCTDPIIWYCHSVICFSDFIDYSSPNHDVIQFGFIKGTEVSGNNLCEFQLVVYHKP